MTEQKPLEHSLEGKRRIVTILFCDVKRSTAMAEKTVAQLLGMRFWLISMHASPLAKER